MYLFLTNHRQGVLTSSRRITARKRWGDTLKSRLTPGQAAPPAAAGSIAVILLGLRRARRPAAAPDARSAAVIVYFSLTLRERTSFAAFPQL